MRAVVVVNPTKVKSVDRLRGLVERRCRAQGWEQPDLVQSTREDPGEGMARTAAQGGADLVLSAGGDGTVMSVARGLAGSGVALGILPVGTGNLLARNLDLPLDLEAALDIALTGASRRIDLGRLTGDAHAAPQGFAVMAGLGFDAAMMADAPDGLKSALGWPAYVVSGLRHLRDRPVGVELRVDDAPVVKRSARGVIVGNVGTLQAGLKLMPDAVPDDGLLDVVVLAPHRSSDWLRVIARLLVRRRGGDRAVERLRGRRVELTVDRPQPCQLDGEATGDTQHLVLEVDPGALVVRVRR